MRRRFFAIASALSLLLCVATAVLWARSYCVSDFVYWASNENQIDHTIRLSTGRGGIDLGGYSNSGNQFATDSELLFRKFPPKYPAGESLFSEFGAGVRTRGGFGVGHDVDLSSDPELSRRWWSIIVPLWSVAVGFAVPPALWFIRYRRIRRRHGHCRACGYDLRGTPHRCPECGLELHRSR